MTTQYSNGYIPPLWDQLSNNKVLVDKASQNITKNGHGIFVASDQGDIYADLRMCSEKPFWGHSHPLSYTTNEELLSSQLFAGYSLSSERIQCTKDYVSFCDITLENEYPKKLTVIICEKILSLSEKEILDRIGIINSISNLTVMEKYLSLYNQDHFSFCLKNGINFNNCLIQFFQSETEQLKISKTKSTTHYLSLSHLQLIKFYNYALGTGPINKFNQNNNIINSFMIKYNKSWCLQNGYIRLSKDFNDSISTFLTRGLLISRENLIGNHYYLAPPSSCTKDELESILKLI